MGGLLGAGLFGLLSGSGLFGGLTDFASFLGLLLQIALIGGVAWLVVNYLRRRNQPAPARAPANLLSSTSPRDLLNRFRQTLASNGGSAASGTPALAIGPGDYDAFERLLREIQSRLRPREHRCAWRHDDSGDALVFQSGPGRERQERPCATKSPVRNSCRVISRKPGTRRAATTPPWRCAIRLLTPWSTEQPAVSSREIASLPKR